MKPENRLSLERGRLSLLVSLLAVTAVTGIATWAVPGMSIWEQWTFLLHSVMGIALATVLLPYVWIHFVRTLGLRRPLLVATGLIALLVSLSMVGTGIWIVLFGQKEAERAVLHWHIWTSLIVFGAVLVHLVAHWLFLPEGRKESNRFPSITKAAATRSLILMTASVVLVLSLSIFHAVTPQPFQDEAVVMPYSMNYGDNPFAPSLMETASGSFLDPARLDDSKVCGGCHSDIFNQWQSSMHAKAGSDKSYQTNIIHLAAKHGIEAVRYCDGCHTPAALAGGVLTDGGSLQSRWHMEEGIGCRSCHSVDEVLHTRGVASYRLNPVEPYLFPGRNKQGIARFLRESAIKLNPEAHRQNLKPALLSEARFCATCHVQFMDETMNQWGWVKMQDEYLAWLNGPFSGHGDKPFANQDKRNCRDCHMPLVKADDPSADEHGRVRSHHFPGANMTIPFFDGDMEQMERNREFLQADRMRVSIIRPDRIDSEVSEHSLEAAARTQHEAPAYYYLGERATINVVVHNIGVGHDFPGGTTDINEAWLTFEVTDASDNTLFSSGRIDNEGHVDPESYFYRSIPVDRDGKHVWNHELFNMVGDSYVNVVPAGRADLTSYSFEVPGWAKSPMTVRVTLRYRKFNQRYAEWSLQSPGINVPIADVAFDTLTIPIRERPNTFR